MTAINARGVVPPGGDPLLTALAGDLDGAFAEFVNAYAPGVYTLALRLCPQPADAEDLASETFTRAHQALRGYPGERVLRLQLRPWLVTITLNLWRNQARTASRRPALVPFDQAAHGPADPYPGPEQHVISADSRAELAALLDALPESQRTAVVLRHVLEWSYADIAAATGHPVGTVKSHVSRGLAALRAELDRAQPDRTELDRTEKVTR